MMFENLDSDLKFVHVRSFENTEKLGDYLNRIKAYFDKIENKLQTLETVERIIRHRKFFELWCIVNIGESKIHFTFKPAERDTRLDWVEILYSFAYVDGYNNDEVKQFMVNFWKEFSYDLDKNTGQLFTQSFHFYSKGVKHSGNRNYLNVYRAKTVSDELWKSVYQDVKLI